MMLKLPKGQFFFFLPFRSLTFFVQLLQYLKPFGRFQNSTHVDIDLFLKANSSFYYIFPLCNHIIFVLFQGSKYSNCLIYIWIFQFIFCNTFNCLANFNSRKAIIIDSLLSIVFLYCVIIYIYILFYFNTFEALNLLIFSLKIFLAFWKF